MPLIINDNIGVALAVDAAGVHLGADDMPPQVARKILGDNKIIGVSARNLEEAVRAEASGADYIGVGAMYATATKSDAAIVSFEELRRIRCACTLPIVAIGGINAARVSDFDGIELDGVCAASAILSSGDIASAARGLRRAFDNRPESSTRFRMSGVECAIFDLDGTLFDSTDVWESIDVKFLEDRGFEATPDYIDAVAAMNFKEVAAYTKERFRLPESAVELIDLWRKMAQDFYAEKIRLKRHAREYLSLLKSMGIRMGVATNLPPNLYEPALKNNGISEFFDCIVSGEETAKGKESPEIFLRTARKLCCAPERCVVFEDVCAAMRSAKAAGMKVCGVYDFYSLGFLSDALKTADYFITDFSRAPLPK